MSDERKWVDPYLSCPPPDAALASFLRHALPGIARHVEDEPVEDDET